MSIGAVQVEHTESYLIGERIGIILGMLEGHMEEIAAFLEDPGLAEVDPCLAALDQIVFKLIKKSRMAVPIVSEASH